MYCCYNSKKVSVIVPTYHNATTIERCIDSILNQNGCDIELIVIIDGDISYRDIIESYRNKAQIIIKEIVHSGVSVARNEGLKLASGDYVLFCDADDIYLPNAFFYMIEAINNTDAVIGYVIKRNAPTIEKSVLNSDEAISKFFSNDENRILGTVYGKLFKRELMEFISFDNLSIGEDAVFLLKYLFRCKSVSMVSSAVYHHFENPTGIICSLKEDYYDSAIYACKKMIEYIIEYQDKSHLEEAIQDLLNVFALLLLRIRSVSWGTKIFTLVLSVLKDIKSTITINEISIYLNNTYRRTIKYNIIRGIEREGGYNIRWPSSIALLPTADNIQYHTEDKELPQDPIDLSHIPTGYEQFYIINIEEVMASHCSDNPVLLGIAYFNK